MVSTQGGNQKCRLDLPDGMLRPDWEAKWRAGEDPSWRGLRMTPPSRSLQSRLRASFLNADIPMREAADTLALRRRSAVAA
jgi:hypothetical protein